MYLYKYSSEDNMSNVSVYGLTVNYASAPIGVDSLPRFSYKIKSDVRGDRQLSRRIKVYSDAERKTVVWDEGEQTTEISFLFPMRARGCCLSQNIISPLPSERLPVRRQLQVANLSRVNWTSAGRENG